VAKRRDTDFEGVQGTIMIRSGPLELDDTLIALVKDLASTSAG
jgi:hypothetical protein